MFQTRKVYGCQSVHEVFCVPDTKVSKIPTESLIFANTGHLQKELTYLNVNL